MGTRVEVRVVGALEVRGPGAAEVGGTAPRTLLALLAVRRRRLVTADQLAEVLWGSRPPARPEAGISTMVSRLRRVLGPGTINGDRNGYRLADSTWVDLSAAAALIEEAEAGLDADRSADCLLPAGRGVELLAGGPVLADFGMQAWVESARMAQAALLRRGRYVLVETALRTGDPDGARRRALAAIAADPLDEVAHRALMRAHDIAGRPDLALGVYERLRAVLAEELGIDPAPVTRDLRRAIKRGAAHHSRPGMRS
jgi:DNA-binding SARP family transcriptional activator